jgi:cytidyltransferase-like protein
MASPVTIPAPRYPAKIATAADALQRIRQLPKPLVFTNGVFDVLHRGHVTCLEQARGLGASLVVAVNTDASVRRLGKDGDAAAQVAATTEGVARVVKLFEYTD